MQRTLCLFLSLETTTPSACGQLHLHRYDLICPSHDHLVARGWLTRGSQLNQEANIGQLVTVPLPATGQSFFEVSLLDVGRTTSVTLTSDSTTPT